MAAQKHSGRFYRFQLNHDPKKWSLPQWLCQDGIKIYYADDRPIGPLPAPYDVTLLPGSGYLPDWRPAPLVFMKPRNWQPGEPLRFPDVQDGGGIRDWIVSDRAKQVFEAIDPAGFAFCPTQVLIGPEMTPYEGPPYWRCDVVRYLDAIDYEKTETEIKHYPYGKIIREPMGWDRACFNGAVIGQHHVFRLTYLPHHEWCDQILMDAIHAAGLNVNMARTWVGIPDVAG